MPNKSTFELPNKGLTKNQVLLLAAEDNVVVARQDLASGEQIYIDNRVVEISGDAPTGFKIARRSIEPGAKILKYGAQIGSAIQAISIGEIVHIHNMKSDYISTFTLDEGNTFSEDRE